MARKRDLKEVDVVANHFGMTRRERLLFGIWLEDAKASGDRGTKNARGDFTMEELHVHASDFLAVVRGDS